MQLPKALPDESLFSRICRHLAICELTLDQALQQLVGDGRAVIHPYLTSNLHLISHFTDESPHRLLSHQTLRPLFSYYLPQYRTVFNDITTASDDTVRASQLSTFRDKEHLSIKHCPLCAKDDLYYFGVAYWHIIHQIPGVEACSKHKIWLIHNEFPNRIHVNGHLLPDTGSKPINCNELALEFTQFVSNKIKSLNANKLSYEILCNSYLKKLSLNGGLTQSGRIKRKKITKELFELSEELFPFQSTLSLRSSVDFRFISSLLSGQYPQHPFKHLLFEFYLSRCQSDRDTRLLNVQKAPMNKEEQCCELLRSGISMAAVSREIDKSRCYVKSIALKNDIPVNLNPKKITKSLKSSVINLAKKGFHRSVLAQIYNISTGSVELIISTTSGLVEWRKQCKAESLRRRYRCQIIRFIASTPNACRQEIKNSHEAAFHWLYIHDRGWLENILPVANQIQHVEKVNWYQRDSEVVNMVRQILFFSNDKLSRTELDKLLGGHGWLISKLKKLPQTKALLVQYRLLTNE